MKTQVDTTQRKNKSKQSTKIELIPYAKRIQYYEMAINDNKEDLGSLDREIQGANLSIGSISLKTIEPFDDCIVNIV